MSMGRREDRQTPMWLAGPELARSPGHRFYEKLNDLLREADFDRGVEQLCAPYFEADNKPGRPSIAPGVYFRMLFVGYFEGIESERGLEWRCADSLSLRTFLGVQVNERVPDHSSLSRTRTRLDGAVYDQVFRLVLGIVESKGLLRGKVAGVDSTYLRADASMKTIVRKDTGDDYTTYLKKLCETQGVENPTVEDARRMDRKRKGKKTSNKDWKSPTDADARIVRLKDGRTRLGYKAEHVVDLETGAIVAAELYRADEADTERCRRAR
jgi:transposase